MKKVLVVDDDAVFVQSMKDILPPEKYSVETAADGEEGLKKVAAVNPDIVLLDIKMPRLDGMGFLMQLNKTQGEGKVPVLITSNSSSMETISEGVALGIRGYVTKSNESLKGILDMIDRFLK